MRLSKGEVVVKIDGEQLVVEVPNTPAHREMDPVNLKKDPVL